MSLTDLNAVVALKAEIYRQQRELGELRNVPNLIADWVGTLPPTLTLSQIAIMIRNGDWLFK